MFVCVRLVPPKLVEGLRSSDGVQGTDIHLSCKADGSPAPAFRFYKVQQLHLPADVCLVLEPGIGAKHSQLTYGIGDIKL